MELDELAFCCNDEIPKGNNEWRLIKCKIQPEITWL